MLIIKLGGSVIQENLESLNPKIFEFIEKITKLDTKVTITVGGGKITRLFQQPLKDKNCRTIDIHLVGIRAVLLQAEYVKGLLPIEGRYPYLIDSDEKHTDAVKNIGKYKYFVSGSWNPGHSSDYESVLLAKSFYSKKVLRITDVNYVYNKDPRTNPDAIIIKKVSWDEYLDIIGNPTEHIPGQSYPVDPLTARLAKENEIKFYLTSLDSFLKLETLDFENFEGSVIG